MQSALQLAQQQAQAAQATRIVSLSLRVGVLSGVVPDALQFAFETLARGTLAEGATMIVESVPARFWCETCTAEFEAEDFLAECPRCQMPAGELRAGRELELKALEII